MSRKKLPDNVVRLEKLTLSDIRHNEVIFIERTDVPGEQLEICESWKELIKMLLCLLYQVNSRGFMNHLYEAKLLDKDFNVTNQEYSMFKNGEMVYTEKIPGAPYYLDYNYSEKTLLQKAKSLSLLLGFKPKDFLLTLKPRSNAAGFKANSKQAIAIL